MRRDFDDLTDEAVFKQHGNLLCTCGNVVLAKQFKRFVIDDNNRDIIHFLLYYFNNCKKAEDVFPGKGYTIHKNLMICGEVGVGKTMLMQVFADYLKRTGNPNAFVNLSGGVGIPYRPDQQATDIMAVGEGVRKAYEEVLVPAGMGDVSIYTELGRFMLAPYGHLVATVLHQKHIYKEYLGLDACAANLMRPAMYGAYHHITVLGKEDQPCDHIYDVTGGLCENNDKFAVDRPLPKTDIGDLVVIHDTGAHGFAMGYNYNGKLRSAEVLLKEDGSHQLIRRAETPEDYFATFDFTPFFHKK